jgi:hypothetical protein
MRSCIEIAYEKAYVTPGKRYRADKTRCPMLPSTSTPSKPEQANYDAGGSDHGTIQPMLGHDVLAAFADHFAVLFLVECPVHEDACDRAKEHTNAD